MKFIHRRSGPALASDPTTRWIRQHQAEFYDPLSDDRGPNDLRSVNFVRCCRGLPWHDRLSAVEREVDRLGIKTGDVVRVTDTWGNEHEAAWACVAKETGDICFANGLLGPRGEETVFIERVEAG